MRIVLAHNIFKLVGGAEVFYHEVGRVLEKNGHEVAYFSPLDDGVISEWSSYFPKAADYRSGNIISNIMSFKDMIYSTETKKKFAELLRDFKPDLVHVFAIYVRLTPSILDACAESNVPVVMSCNDYKHICPNYKLFHGGHVCEKCTKNGRFYNAILHRCCKGSLKYSMASAIEAYVHSFMDIYKKNIHTFLFASEFMAKKTEEIWGKDTFRWDMLKNPFDSHKYEYSETHGDYIVYFGRLIDEKGVDVLIKGMKENPHIPLKIIGSGPDEELLREMAENFELQNVEFLGAKWGEELNIVLRDCRFVVVPSVWHENFPYVILQSFAHGKAVVGSNRGGIPELIQAEEHGLTYDALDDKQLADTIRKLWSNKDQSIEMGKRAKKYMNCQFNDEVFYSNVLKIYNNILCN